jgi:peptide/nickel transport system substrate-binding protein
MKICWHRSPIHHLALWAVAACLAVGLVGGLSVAVAATPSPSSSAGQAKLILHVGWTREPDNLNPFVGYSATDYEIWHLQYDLLTGYDAATLQPRPEFAQSWSHSPDGLVWTFKIRPGMTWQDGQPATAHDVAFTFNYIIKNQMSSFTGYTDGISKVVAPNDTTAIFYCSRPKANMLGMWVPILPAHVWSKINPKLAGTTYPNNLPIVGSGPFQVVEWKHGSFIRLVANPHYWAGRPKVDEVIFETYQNADTMAQDLKTGALAAAWGIPPAEVQSLNSPSVKSISYTSIGFDQLTFNCAPAPATGNPVLRDPAFRQALNYAIDKQTIATIAYNGQVNPATSMIPAGLYPASLDYHWQPSAAQQYPFDLAKASAALTAAGYPLKNGVRVDKQGKPIKLRLLARAESIMSQASGKLITGWFKQLGLDINFQTVTEDTLSGQVYNTVKGKTEPSYDMFLWGWVGDADPNFLVSILTSDEIGMWNQSAWTSPAYDKLFQLQGQQLDPQQRKQTIWKMQQIVYDQTPFIPLIYNRDQEAYNTADWTGWVSSPASHGGVILCGEDQTDSYRLVHPVGATTTSTSGSRLWIVWIVVAAVVVALAAFLVRRSRGRHAEEL